MSKNSDQPTTLLINSFYLSAKRNQILLRLNSKCQGTGTSSNLTLVPLKRNFLSTVDRWPRKATAKSRGLAETYIPNSPLPLSSSFSRLLFSSVSPAISSISLCFSSSLFSRIICFSCCAPFSLRFVP